MPSFCQGLGLLQNGSPSLIRSVSEGSWERACSQPSHTASCFDIFTRPRRLQFVPPAAQKTTCWCPWAHVTRSYQLARITNYSPANKPKSSSLGKKKTWTKSEEYEPWSAVTCAAKRHMKTFLKTVWVMFASVRSAEHKQTNISRVELIRTQFN